MNRVSILLLAVLVVVAGVVAAAPRPSASSGGVIDPRLDAALRRGMETRIVRGPAGDRPELRPLSAPGAGVDAGIVPVLITGDVDVDALRALGGRVRTTAGSVRTVDLPVAEVARVAALPGVERIALPAPLRPTLDVSIPAIDLPERTRVGDTFTGATGEGVIVGIVDTGIDVTHEDFLDEPGVSRILAYWSQVDPAGPPPAEVEGAGGTEWLRAAIEAGAAAGPDTLGHGTHVASIAAGIGRAADVDSLRYRYVGLAPEADIIAVQVIPTEDNILDAVSYILAKATALARPVVINLSIGTQFGPHDGTSALDLGLTAMVGPGRLVVAAAGNEGNDWIHAEMTIAGGGRDSASVVLSYPAGPSDVFNVLDIDAYYDGLSSLAITVVSPTGARFGPYSLGAVQPDTLTGSGSLYLEHRPWSEGTTTRQLFIELSDTPAGGEEFAPPPAAGTWRVVAANGGPASTEIDLWIATAYPIYAAWTEDVHDGEETLTSPATAVGVIAVGSFNTRRCWPTAAGQRCSSLVPALTEVGKLTYFSSWGPTRDGRMKPDVVAPGFLIVAAKSSALFPGWEELTGMDPADITTPDGRHLVQGGTSMSAPHVTGALALALAERSFGPEEAAELLHATARSDAYTGVVPNPAAGYGKLDVAALVGRVPAEPRVLRVEAGAGGGVVLRWESVEAEDVISFRLEKGTASGWSELARYDGPGPHRAEDAEGRDGDRYRLWSRGRDGRETLWAEAVAKLPAPVLFARPNPFRSATTLALGGTAAGPIEILDLSGRRVRRLTVVAGERSVGWDGRDDAGREAPAGVYWIRIPDVPGGGVRVVRLP